MGGLERVSVIYRRLADLERCNCRRKAFTLGRGFGPKAKDHCTRLYFSNDFVLQKLFSRWLSCLRPYQVMTTTRLCLMLRRMHAKVHLPRHQDGTTAGRIC